MFAPGSIGNVGPGFDVLGMAIDGMGDTVTVELRDRAEVIVRGRDAELVPVDPAKNAAAIAAAAMLRGRPAAVIIDKGIPVSAGLGGSASSSVAGAYAAALAAGIDASPVAIMTVVAVSGVSRKPTARVPFCDTPARRMGRARVSVCVCSPVVASYQTSCRPALCTSRSPPTNPPGSVNVRSPVCRSTTLTGPSAWLRKPSSEPCASANWLGAQLSGEHGAAWAAPGRATVAAASTASTTRLMA